MPEASDPSAASVLTVGQLRELVMERRDEINAVVRRHRGHAIALFGSVARGDDDSASDIDFLVEFDQGSSLFDLMDLQEASASEFSRRFTTRG